MTKKENTEHCYIYFANHKDMFTMAKTLTEIKAIYLYLGRELFVDDCQKIKIGETRSFDSRRSNLLSTNRMTITRYVEFEGTKDERLFLESYLRSKFTCNCNMKPYGNDYFSCANSKTIKGAENKFFSYVAEGFEVLSQIKNKNYKYTCEILDKEA